MIASLPPIQLNDGATTVAWCLLVGLALMGKPLFAVLAGTAILSYLGMEDMPLETMFLEFGQIAQQPLFITIPMFVLAGTLLAESRAPSRLVGLARALLGWLPGGLAIVATVCSAFFTAVTGASGVTIVALGGLLYPILKKDGYPERFNVGLLTTGGSLGLLFVPSLPIIVYGLISGVDVDTLFLAGIVPGVLLIGVIGIYAVTVGVASKVPTRPAPWKQPREVGRALRSAAFEAPIPFLIILGIYSGKVTALETAPLAALYCLFVEVVVYRDIKLRELPFIARRTAELVGAIMVILGMAMAVKNYLVQAEVPQQILWAMSTHIDDQLTFLLVLNVFLLVTGCLLDIFSAILVVVPLVAPLAMQYGVDPVHLGIIFLTNLEIGYLTPPVGINLFLGSLRFKRPLLWVAGTIIPFLLLLVLCLAAITYLPSLSTGLVDLVKGPPQATPVDRFKDGVRERFERWTGRDGRDLMHGRYEAWYLDGTLKEDGRHLYGNRHTLESADQPSERGERPWVSYWPNGAKKAEGHYRYGRPHGMWTTWSEGGVKLSEGPYVDGRKHGYWREWAEDGQKFAEGTFVDGMRHGPWIDWIGDEHKLYEGAFVDDLPHGRWAQWDEETGERLPDKLWDHGAEVGEAPAEDAGP